MTPDMTQVARYCEELTECGRKPNTVQTYRNGIRRCLEYLEMDGRPTRAEEIGIADVRYLYGVLPVKEEVKKTYLRYLACFIIHYTGRDVVKQAKLLWNRETRERTFISTEDYVAMWRIANEFERMILVLGGLMGLRREEMVNIRDEDLDMRSLRIHGKGHGAEGMIAVVEVPELVMEQIARYRIHKSTFPNKGDGYLLQTPGKDRRTFCKVHKSRVSDTVRLLGRRAGVKATTHSLRRFYASVLYHDLEVDLRTLQQMMRHADVSTTLKCYVNASQTKSHEAIESLMDLISKRIGE